MHDGEFTSVQYGITKFEGTKAAKLDIEAVYLFLLSNTEFVRDKYSRFYYNACANIQYYRL